ASTTPSWNSSSAWVSGRRTWSRSNCRLKRPAIPRRNANMPDYFLRRSPERMQSAARLLGTVALLALASLPSLAAAATLPVPAPPVIGAKSYMLIDGNSGYQLAAHAADVQLAPAGLTKIMSAYAIFKALDEGQIRLEDEVTVS